MTTIYKICPVALWEEAQHRGFFAGAPVDLADGYIHFSTAEQVKETAAKHFRDQGDLMLLWIESDRLGAALKWEPARLGALFPHLYGALDIRDVSRAARLPLGADGAHVFPALD